MSQIYDSFFLLKKRLNQFHFSKIPIIHLQDGKKKLNSSIQMHYFLFLRKLKSKETFFKLD